MTKLPDNLLRDVKSVAKIADIVALRVQIKKRGREYLGLCPFHSDRTPSFTVIPDKNFAHCFGCGWSGDPIGFLMTHDHLEFAEAVMQIGNFYGLASAPAPGKKLFKNVAPVRVPTREEDEAAAQKEIAKARDLYAAAMPAAGTLVETYLRARAIEPDRLPDGVLSQIRFMPEMAYYAPGDKRAVMMGMCPAMVAPMQNSNGKIQAVHLTYLRADGSGKVDFKDAQGKALPAKKVKGKPWGCAIRLGPKAATMAVSEGIENALTHYMVKPDVPVWAAYSLYNLAGHGLVNTAEPHPEKPGLFLPSRYPDFSKPGFVPPAECHTMYVLAENDGDRHATACLVERATRRLSQNGLRTIPVWSSEGMDHNDMLRAGAA